jgi:MFS family permease
VVSAFGFLTVLLLALYASPSVETVTWRKPVVGAIFAVICFLGIVGSLSPRKCLETFGHKRGVYAVVSSPRASGLAVSIRGHHYDCGEFSSHTVRVNGHVLCAACTGLFLGGGGALLGTLLFFFSGLGVGQFGFLSVAVGVAAMIFGFLQVEFSGFARLILNVLFVLGAFLILAGLDALIGSLLVDLFSIVLTVFWIFTRILLSQWDHWRICRRCPLLCEAHVTTSAVPAGLPSSA